MPKGLGLWPMAASRNRVLYGPFSPTKMLALMKQRGYWKAKEDEPDFGRLFQAFVEANGWDNARNVRTLSNWASGGTEPGSTDSAYLANALGCKPEDLLERL